MVLDTVLSYPTLAFASTAVYRLLDPRSAIGESSNLALFATEGLNKQRRQKNEARYRRLKELCRSLDTTASTAIAIEQELKEYQGLTSLGDPYDPTLFTSDHATFKASHNKAFAQLARNLVDECDKSCPVFYLDGADGGTTSVLLDAGFDRSDLYMANEWEDSIHSLQSEPCNLLKDRCIHGRAEDVLRTDYFREVPFVAAYFDGCGGSAQPIIEMVEALFDGNLASEFAIAFTLTIFEPTGRELIDRVQDVTREIMSEARRQGYDMRHVGDDPERYGVDPDLVRKHGGTCTAWIVCCRDSAK